MSDSACWGQTEGEAKHFSGHKCPPDFVVVKRGRSTDENLWDKDVRDVPLWMVDENIRKFVDFRI